MGVEAKNFEPSITLVYCRQSLAEGEEPFEGKRRGQGFSARLVLLPCSSKMQTAFLMRILENGSDAVQIVACPEKACQHLVGSTRAEKRLVYAQDLLEQVGMGGQRLGLERGLGLTIDNIMDLASQRAAAVAALGPNPMKGESSQ